MPSNRERFIQAEDAPAVSISPVHIEMAELRKTKGQDYNQGCTIDDYFPFGELSYAHMLHLKSKRLVSLVNAMLQGQAPNHEGIRDTVLDLLNYGTYFIEAIDNGTLNKMDLGNLGKNERSEPLGVVKES